MATKRPAPSVHPSRQDQVPGEPKRKRRKPDNAGPKSFKKAHPVNELKSQIRSLKRLLDRDERLPATVRIEKERALRTAQHELEQTQRAKARSDMIARYHKIRFFERQKATKRLKQARKQLAAFDGAEGERAEIAKRVEEYEVAVNYAQFYPLEQHYVSLWPRKRDGEEGEDEQSGSGGQSGVDEWKGDPKMWLRVKQCMADGTLDDLRNGRLDDAGEDVDEAERQKGVGKDAVKNKKRKPAGGKEGSAPADHRDEAFDDDQESDGGFFE